ncbi:MAG: hypothetical protein WCB92_20345 [Mycobacterium sp.]
MTPARMGLGAVEDFDTYFGVAPAVESARQRSLGCSAMFDIERFMRDAKITQHLP